MAKQETVHSKDRTKTDTGAEAKQVKRLTVDLSPDAAAQFEKLLQDRGLTISQAVRQALSLLALYDDSRYDLILRDRSGKEQEQRVLLVK